MAEKKFEFSKLIIIFEALLIAYLTYQGMMLAKLCVTNSYGGNLAFLTTLLSCAWAAFGTSVAFYYNKAKAENQRKIPQCLPVQGEALNRERREEDKTVNPS